MYTYVYMYMMYICVNCTSLISMLTAESQSSQSNSSVISRLLSSAQVTPKTHVLLTLCFIMWVRDARRHSLQIEAVVVVIWWLCNRALADLLCVDVLDWTGVQCIICMFVCSGVLKLPYNCCQPRDTYATSNWSSTLYGDLHYMYMYCANSILPSIWL